MSFQEGTKLGGAMEKIPLTPSRFVQTAAAALDRA